MRQKLLLHLYVAFLAVWCSVAQFIVRTPEGIQCPTAAIQQIAVPIKSCCGKIVRVEWRKPKPGEGEFLQCRCAEKSSSRQQSDLDHGGPHIDLFVPATFALRIPILYPAQAVADEGEPLGSPVYVSPPVPPPSCA